MNTDGQKHFYFKLFSLVKVVIQPIQFNISIDFVYTELNVKTVPFQRIQFSISTQFSSIWPIDVAPDKVLPLQTRMDLGAMAMKGCSEFPKPPALLELQHQIV